MSSSVKTDSLELNLWQGSDIPQREDFVRDNAIIDNAFSTHFEDTDRHITSEERSKWNNVYHMFTFFGNGALGRSIEASCSFTPSWGLVFAYGKAPAVTDFDNTSDYNYFALVTQHGSTAGASLNGKTISLVQSSSPVSGNEYRNFNESGVTYAVILFA